MEGLMTLWHSTALANFESGQVIMMLVGALLLFLAIKKGFEPLLLVDYTHAVKNLQEIIELILDNKKNSNLVKKWQKMLWEGKISEMKEEIEKVLTGNKRKEALKKWRN